MYDRTIRTATAVFVALCAAAAMTATTAAAATETPASDPQESAEAFITYRKAWEAPCPKKKYIYADVAVMPDGGVMALCWHWGKRHNGFVGVELFTPDGQQKAFFENSEEKPEGSFRLAVDGTGGYYCLSTMITYLFGPDGGFSGQVVTVHPKMAQGLTQTGISRNGKVLYGVDWRSGVGAFDMMGRLQASRRFEKRVLDIAVAPDGEVFTTVYGDNGICGIAFDSDLRERWRFGRGGSDESRANAIAASRRTIAVSDPAGPGVFYFDRNGCVLGVIPSVVATSLAIGRDERIYCVINRDVVCYERVYGDIGELKPSSRLYLDALTAFDEGREEEARKKLDELLAEDGLNAGMRQTARRLKEMPPSALARHILPERPLSEREARATVAREFGEHTSVGVVAADPFESGVWWVALDGGFCVRLGVDESIETFGGFVESRGGWKINGFAFSAGSVWAATDRGVVRFDRDDRLWLAIAQSVGSRIEKVEVTDGKVSAYRDDGEVFELDISRE